jgi:hypothetical protein
MRVWGEVSLDGKPVEKGTIEFSPVDGTLGGAAAGPIEAGKYDLSAAAGPVAKGKYRVAISALRPVGKPLPNIIEPGGPPLQSLENYIPDAYNAKSTLTATIAEDASKNQLDYALKSGAAGRK